MRGDNSNKKNSLMSRLFFFSEKHKYLTICGMVLSGISSIVVLIPIVLIWIGISKVFAVYPNISDVALEVKKYAWYSLLFAIMGIVIYFLGLMCTHIAAFRIARNMRIKAIKHLMVLPLGYFNEQGSGKLRRVVDDSAMQTESFLAHHLPDIVGAFLTPVVTVALLFVFDWKLGIVSLIPVIISMVFLSNMRGPKRAKSMREYRNALDNMNNQAIEYIRGVPVVKTFGQSIFSFEKFHNSIKCYKDWVVKYTISVRGPMCGYVVSINAISVFLAIAGAMLIPSILNPNAFLLDFIFYLIFTPVCVTMMNKIMWASNNIMLAKDATNRIYDLLSKKPLKEYEHKQLPKDSEITFDHVHFKYPNAEKSAISDINFKIPNGGTVALVGPSGGGKSTVASLIPRFWDVTEGVIKIGGVDIRNISTNELMNQVSFVFQDSKLFKESILDNVKEGNPSANMQQVMKAIKAAQCENIIEKLPDGIHTVVGTKGSYLSGGEQQRIAIARAILKDAPIIILDEATAFADPENENQIQCAFEKLTEGKTVLIIAHRLSTIQNVDNIYVIDQGEICESGKHGELIDQHGVYAHMWKEYQTSISWKMKEAK